MVFGPIKHSNAGIPTDPILLKSDLFPTYHLASVIDDHEMGITHVLRGEVRTFFCYFSGPWFTSFCVQEWLPSLPLHLDLYACLSLSPPQYAHMPILLNPDGTKMSKRKGDIQVLEYIVSSSELVGKD